jgi:hypothetical protein
MSLFLSRLIRSDSPFYKGYPSDVTGKVEYTLKMVNNEILAHFSREEEVIVPLATGFNDELDQLLARMLKEHKQLMDNFNELITETDINVQADLLDKTGRLLENHIRMEERELFMKIQEFVPEENLKKIEEKLAHSH